MDNDVDQALVERYRNGDRDAFTELVIRYQRPIYNAAFWILRSADDASDIAQGVFLKVAEHLDDYRDVDTFDFLKELVESPEFNADRD